jgi:hypothetical protein
MRKLPDEPSTPLLRYDSKYRFWSFSFRFDVDVGNINPQPWLSAWMIVARNYRIARK